MSYSYIAIFCFYHAYRAFNIWIIFYSPKELGSTDLSYIFLFHTYYSVFRENYQTYAYIYP